MPVTPTGNRPLLRTPETTSPDTAPEAVDQPRAPSLPSVYTTDSLAEMSRKTGLDLRPDLHLIPTATPASPVEVALKQAIDRYTTRVETALHHDALSLAQGQKPILEGQPIPEATLTELNNASRDFFKDIPVGALAPDIAYSIGRKLSDANIQTRDLPSTSLGDLGHIGGDIALDLTKKLKANSPAGYYGLAAGLAAVIGYEGWAKGSAALEKVGIKPEIKEHFFDDQLEAKLRGDWDAHFKNFKATVEVNGNYQLTSVSKLTGTVVANSRDGFERLQLGYQYQPRDNMTLSGALGVARGGRTTTQVDAVYTRGNTSFALSARADSQGEKYVGVGFTARW